MKKVLVLIAIFSALIISGCTQNNYFTIKSKEFTDEQNEILSLTGNRAFKYDLKNLPKNKNYELKIVYEIYKNKEKVKEEIIFGMVYGPTEDKIEDTNLSINIQENKIRLMSGGAYTNLEVEEDLSKLTNYYFSGNRKIDIGDEVYLFHANDGSSALSIDRLGFLSKEDLNRLLEENKMNIFIKLACEEIKK